MSNHPNPEQRARVEKEALIDRYEKTVQHLLSDVHDESVNASPNEAPLTRTMARFASLLCALSDQAEIQTRKIVNLTWGLFLLTVALLVFTAYLSYDVYLKSKRDAQTTETKPK